MVYLFMEGSWKSCQWGLPGAAWRSDALGAGGWTAGQVCILGMPTMKSIHGKWKTIVLKWTHSSKSGRKLRKGSAPVDFRELTYVLAIARHQNITKAAESLFVSQPTLSKFLIGLEKDIGLPLFQKIGHRYQLTYAGERYVETAQKIIRLKNDLDMEMADIIKRDVGVVKVAFSPMRCSYMLPFTLPAFQAAHPNVKVEIYEGYADDNDRRLLSGEIDVAFYSKPNPNDLNSRIEYETLWQEELLICTSENHPIGHFARPNPASRYPMLNPALLQKELLLQMLPEQRTRQITDDYFRQHGLTFENVVYTSNLRAIMELVSVGYGVAFIFESHLRHREITRPIRTYSFGEPRNLWDFVAAYRKGSYVSNYVREFIEMTRQYFHKE